MKKGIVRIITIVLVVFSIIAAVGCNPVNGNNTDPIPPQPPVSGKRIYFAGPLFSEAEREYNLKVVAVLEEAGYEVFLPQRDGYLAPDLAGKSAGEITSMIFNKDKEEVLKADIVFILLDGRVPDEGACVELGIGYAAGKRCYGIKSDSRSIELGMDLNPMITGCLIKLFYDLDGEALLNSLKDYLKNNQL